MLNWFTSLFSTNKWLIEVSYSKHNGKYYPLGPKSNSHKGAETSNQWMQSEFIQDAAPTLTEIVDDVKTVHKNAGNIKVVKIQKL